MLPLLLVVVFIAAVARGYTGFGLSAIIITVMSQWIPARELVPILILLEISASLLLIRSISGNIEWRIVALIFAGAAITTPLALLLLTKLPTHLTHTLIALLAFTATLLLMLKRNLAITYSNPVWFGAGLVVGAFGGLGSIGGLASMVILLSTTLDAARTRATMFFLLLTTSVYAAMISAGSRMVSKSSLELFILLLIPTISGLFIGNLLFKRYSRSFRRLTLSLLVVLSATMLVRSVVQFSMQNL